MQITASLVVVFLLAVAPATSAHEAAAHPIETVIDLLKELSKKVDEEGVAEQGDYDKFMTWCTESTSKLETAITSSKEDIDALYDKIKANEQSIASLTEEIAYLGDEVAKKEAAGLAAKKVRDDAKDLYTKADEDYTKTITAIGEAITELEGAKPAALLDVSRTVLGLPLVLEQLSDEQREAFVNAAKQSYVPGRNGTAASEADKKMLKQIKGVESYVSSGGADYIFKSGNVLELLANLKKHFETEKLEATKAETAAAMEYELADKARTAAITAANDLKATKTTTLGDTKEELSENKGDLADEKAEVKADSKLLEETQESCAQKTAEWKERSKTRLAELKALDQAMFILSQVTGVQYEKPELKTLPTSPTLLQLRQISSKDNDPKAKALQLLRAQAKKARSRAFNDFVLKVTSALKNAGKDTPFDEVINMIQKMIFRLQAEQTSEDEHKYWCDEETSKTNTSIDAKDAKVKALTAEITEKKASIGVLETEIEDNTKKVADITEWVKEVTEVHEDNKKDNAAAIEDAEEAIAALKKAIAVLTKFYEGSGMIAIALVQKKEPEPVVLGEKPETWSASYTGTSDPKNQPTGIITVLEKTSDEFATMIEETKQAEAADQVKFNEDMQANQIAKSTATALIDTKTEEKNGLVEKVSVLTDKKKHVQGELDATIQYYKDLASACRDADSTYAERKAARTDEIEALKQAQTILATAFESFVQQKPAFLQRKPIRRV